MWRSSLRKELGVSIIGYKVENFNRESGIFPQPLKTAE